MVIEDRLALIQMLEKKYAPTIPLLIEFKEKCEEKLKSLEESEATLEDLKQEYKKTYSQACEIADILHEKRILGAKKLSALIQETLSYLDMPKVRFEISVQSIKKDSGLVLSLRGSDDVEFLIATNVGEELASMNKIASGGELSRIMLALKSAVSDKNGAQAIVFDEIDTGVSGSTSQRIGIKLAGISKRTQTFCVTHSAQIAALADNHYFIKKDEIDGRAETKILLLVEQERISEIARIIGGINITEKQIAAAKDLLSQSRNLLD